MTLPQEALAAPVSDQSAAAVQIKTPDNLICPASDIFDVPRIAGGLDEALQGLTDHKEIRAATVAVLGQARDEGRARIKAAFEAEPLAARETVAAYSWLMDGIVTAVLDVAVRYLHPLPSPTASERVAVVAVGGYGRAEMAPHSDVDLLFLTPYKTTAWAESVIESMLYIFWDLHLKVGHSTRTVKDCLRLGKEDYTIRTALLEHRFLAGERITGRRP